MRQDVRGAETSGQFSRGDTWSSAPQGTSEMMWMCPRGNSAEGRGNCWVHPLLRVVVVGRVAPGCEVPGAFSLLRTLAKLTPTVRKPLQGKSVGWGGGAGDSGADSGVSSK